MPRKETRKETRKEHKKGTKRKVLKYGDAYIIMEAVVLWIYRKLEMEIN